jgi:MerR family transcriptional regulator, redox-sensitive transcriptional activator SoxR
MPDAAVLTIGEVARQAGVNTSAIRYYERVGVLPEPDRVGGQRRYTHETIRRLGVIDVAKQAGFSLDETRALLHADADSAAHAELRDLADRKLPEVEALIARAQAMRDWLLAARGCTCDTLDVCGLFEAGARGGRWEPAGQATSRSLPVSTS